MTLRLHHLTVPGILPPPGISLSCEAGTVTGIIGPNGAGKSTLMKAIYGRMPGASGRVTLGDRELTTMRPEEQATLVAVVPQDTSSGGGYSVADMVGLARSPHLGRYGMMRAADTGRVERALTLTGMSAYAQRTVDRLSGGQRQLAHIARAICQDTPVILLDEPVSDLDIRHELQVLRLLQDLARRGTTILVVLHNLESAARFCDRLVLLSGGQLVGQGPPAEVLDEATLAAHYHVRARVSQDPDTHSLRVTVLDTLDPDETTLHSSPSQKEEKP